LDNFVTLIREAGPGSRRGGIGRRVGLRVQCFRTYGFKSRRLLIGAINLAAKWLAYTEQTVVRFRHCPLLGSSLTVEYWVVVPRGAGSTPVSPVP
jgi:hypothetical protein